MKEKRKTRWRSMGAAGAALLAAAAVLQFCARHISGFGEAYCLRVYPWIVGIYGRFFGIFPFSVAEILLYLCIIWLICGGLSHIIRLFLRKEGWREAAARVFSALFLFAGLLAFLYTACCGINYYRRPFSSYLDLQVRESSVDELRDLCGYLVRMVNETTDGAEYDPSWIAEGQEAMNRLAGEYPPLAGYYPRPKPLAVSWILSVQQLSGIYSPFTVEANFNADMTGYNIPHTICHELSHLRGFMREDEANFIGYLACVGSENRAFRYSGYLTGWVYAGNALAAQDPEGYRMLRDRLNEKAVADLAANNAFWNRYEGKVAEAANQMNDAYLKINDQPDGVRSYGRMVDLMLAYQRSHSH